MPDVWNVSADDDPDLERLATEVFDHQMPYGLALLDEHYTALWVSAGFCRLLGYEQHEVVGQKMTDLTDIEDLAPLMPVGAEMLELAPTLPSGPYAAWAVEIPVRMRAASGHWIPMSVTGRYVRRDGTLLLCYRLATDRHANAAVIGALMGDVALADTLDRLIDLVRSQLGARRAWFVHDVFGEIEIIHGDEASVGVKDLRGHLEQVRRGDIHPAPHCRGTRWVAPVMSTQMPAVSGDLVDHGSATQVLGLLVIELGHDLNPYEKYVLGNITGLASLVLGRAIVDRSLQLAATTDDLTGLLNRRAFEARLATAGCEADALPLTLFFLDLDGFKAINDAYGHLVGDAVLSTVARRIKAAVRDSDAAARTGGDEFSILCTRIDAALAEVIAARLLAALNEPVHLDSAELHVAASLGVATAYHADEVADLVVRADQDMYEHKRSIHN